MRANGFTLLELIIVIILLGMLATSAAPRLLEIGRDARISALENIASQMDTTNKLVQYKARIQGIRPTPTNPGNQSAYIIDFGGWSTEVMHSNLCPEAVSELGASPTPYIGYMNVSNDLARRHNNQYAAIGYTLPATGFSTTQGCYVRYNSFDANCEVLVVDTDC